MIYDSLNMPVLDCVPETARRILDIGCGSGAMGKYLKDRQNCHITGITYAEEEAVVARQHLDEVTVADLNAFDSEKLGEFDCILCSHVLEHLYLPERVLQRLRPNLSGSGLLVVGLPNLMVFKQRLQLLRGNFKYEERGGIMDKTHYRFFDWDTARQLIRDGGFELVHAEAQGNFPLPGFRRVLPHFSRSVDKWALKTAPGLFGWQFVMTARKPRS
jgi:SAM-dependent methyltransferase